MQSTALEHQMDELALLSTDLGRVIEDAPGQLAVAGGPL